MLKNLLFFLLFTTSFLQGQSVVDIIVNSDDHNTLEAAVLAAGLETTLSQDGPFTVFAPTDDAFAALGQDLIDDLLENPGGALTNVLLHHVAAGSVQSNELMDGVPVTTSFGQMIDVTINADGVFINNAKVTMADIPADNGVVHVIDAVLVPSGNFSTIMDIVATSDDHTILQTALEASQLNTVLNGEGPYTLFAPTDDAFNALPAGTIDALLQDPMGDLSQILLYHVVNASADAASLSNGQQIMTVNGKSITVTINNDGVFIDDAKVIVTDLPGTNGLVHVIDAVLLPREITVVDIVVNSPDHNILETAVLAAGLETTLSGDGPFTLFAPTDDAFNALPDGTIDALLQDPDGILTDILLYHTVPSIAVSTDLSNGQRLTTVNGKDVIIAVNSDGIFINESQVVFEDIITDNGVVHVLDMVLLPPNSVFDVVAASPDHNILETAIRATGLEDAVSNLDMTLYAPTDAAFEKLPDGTVDFLIQNPNLLAGILLLHTVVEGLESEEFLDPDFAPLYLTYSGSALTIENDGTDYTVNGIDVEVADIPADNGFVNVINTIILNPDSTIIDVVRNSPDHTILETAIDSLGQNATNILESYGPYTLFAPVNDAFSGLTNEEIEDLLNDEDALGQIIGDHVIYGKSLAADFSDGQVVSTLNETELTVSITSEGVFVNNAKVIMPNIETDNGVVHVVDQIISTEQEVTTVWNIVQNSPDHMILETAVEAAGLEAALDDASASLTLFAPTDDAFNNLPDGTIDALLQDPTGALTDILTYHVLGFEAFSSALSDGQMVTTLNGKDVTVSINANGVFINDAQVTVIDVPAENGVVHVIDAVLLPPRITVVDVIVNSPDHTILETAVTEAGLVTTLQGDGPFTVFAPTDDAFNALPAGTLDALLQDPTGELTSILLYHVVNDEAPSTSLMDGMSIETINGQSVTVTIDNNGVFINNAQVTMVDLATDNGIVHVIDAVLLPTTSTDDQNLVDANIYPNPVNQDFFYNVSQNTKEHVEVTILDLNGRIIQRHINALPEGQVDVNALHSGTYSVEIKNNEVTAVQKFIKL